MYTLENTLRIARRVNNSKRSFILVNPLQAKHIPSLPSDALRMMSTLGEKLAEKYGDTGLVIGFAETATAIGAVVAQHLCEGCTYIHTTRENYSEVSEWIIFSEEHSHAVEQKLAADRLSEFLRRTARIIIVDDEISTGKTVKNLIVRLRERFPEETQGKPIIVGSVLNHIPERERKLLSGQGIEFVSLIYCSEKDDYSAVSERYMVHRAEKLNPSSSSDRDYTIISTCKAFERTAFGVNAAFYKKDVTDICFDAVKRLEKQCLLRGRILILGAEENIYPAIVLAGILELYEGCDVLCHGTTRSPIGISSEEGYPVFSGYEISSFYSKNRRTFIYNIKSYDMIIVVADRSENYINAMRDIGSVFDTDRLFLVGGNYDAQQL